MTTQMNASNASLASTSQTTIKKDSTPKAKPLDQKVLLKVLKILESGLPITGDLFLAQTKLKIVHDLAGSDQICRQLAFSSVMTASVLTSPEKHYSSQIPLKLIKDFIKIFDFGNHGADRQILQKSRQATKNNDFLRGRELQRYESTYRKLEHVFKQTASSHPVTEKLKQLSSERKFKEAVSYAVQQISALDLSDPLLFTCFEGTENQQLDTETLLEGLKLLRKPLKAPGVYWSLEKQGSQNHTLSGFSKDYAKNYIRALNCFLLMYKNPNLDSEQQSSVTMAEQAIITCLKPLFRDLVAAKRFGPLALLSAYYLGLVKDSKDYEDLKVELMKLSFNKDEQFDRFFRRLQNSPATSYSKKLQEVLWNQLLY